jgi:hypothetical protein
MFSISLNKINQNESRDQNQLVFTIEMLVGVTVAV